MLCAISCSMAYGMGTPRDFLFMDYSKYFDGLGIDLIMVSNAVSNVERYLSNFKIEGLILSGGNSLLDSALRDKQEHRLLEMAIEKRWPVLGVCRGMQFINYYFGGRMGKVDGHVRIFHNIVIEGTLWSRALKKNKIRVNSFHDDGIAADQVSPKLEKIGYSEDGVVEALRHPNLPIVGVQWHPERGLNADSTKITKFFKDRKGYWN